jgi:hypothetical protein
MNYLDAMAPALLQQSVKISRFLVPNRGNRRNANPEGCGRINNGLTTDSAGFHPFRPRILEQNQP